MENENVSPAASVSETKPRLPRVGQLLKESCQFYGEHLWTFVLIMILPLAIALVQSLVFPNPGVPQTIIGIVAGIVGLLANIALIYFVSKNGNPEGGIGEVCGRSIALFIPALWISIIVAITSIGGYILIIIPGIYISILMAFSIFALVTENRRSVSSVIRSWSLVKGYWWAVFGRLVMFLLVAILAYAVIAIILFIAGVPLETVVEGKTAASPIQNVLYALIYNLIFIPWGVTYMFKIFQSLTAIKAEPAAEESEKTKRNIMIFTIIGVIVILAALVFSAFIASVLTKMALEKGATAVILPFVSY